MTTTSATPADPPSAGARARNRRGQGGQLRADILRAAAELLDETGDERSVTLRAVARRVGISAPSIYAHFTDPQAILLAIVDDAFSELRSSLLAAQADAGDDRVERLRAACTAYLDFASTRPERYRVMFAGLWNAAAALERDAITASEAADLGQDSIEVLVDALAACAEVGRSTSTDPFRDAVALWVALHGLAHQRIVAPLFPWPDGLADTLVDALAHLRAA